MLPQLTMVPPIQLRPSRAAVIRNVQSKLESYFEFGRLGTNWRTELLAGLTTFVTMGDIIFVNPSIFHEAGLPYQAVVVPRA